MAIYRLRVVYKVFLGLCLVLLIVLLSTEIFFSFAEDNAQHDDSANPVGSIQWAENSEGFQEGEGKKFDFQEVDENWIDRYSEGGLTVEVGCDLLRCKRTEVVETL